LDASGQARDCSGWYTDWDAATLRANALADLAGRLDAVDALPLVPAGTRLGAPIARPGKVICIGLNYRDHAEESGMPVPEEPVLFMKAPNTVVGPNDTIRIPRGSEKTDWEVELGVVVGRDLNYAADEAEAARAIAGYCISHDVSERAFQLERGGQWVKGKSCDTFNPTGPWLVTPDDVPDPQALVLELDVNGEARQRGTTATMIFGVYHLVHYISQFMTLEAGDLITTGTPPGVGLGMKPPQYLKPGDRVRLAITGLGEQQAVCAATP
jgi:2-keto-4-pentenoate hydratase/2-oxohepta-3-ene-1,7-dioic acid hydratase in catechol pathway